jgi:HD-GYP domain-containing protein (c-di-GMP phosphodiesterase class II)
MFPEQPPITDEEDSRVAALREAVAAGEYEIDAELVAEAIVRRLSGRDQASELPAPAVPRPRIALASSRPSAEELARAQLNRYAIDLRRSYERELRRTEKLEEASVATVRALAMIVERDDGTGNHLERVHDMGLLLAREIVPEDADDPELGYGFILHDIGKVAVPDAVLRKRGPLDDEEWEILKSHPEIGARILEPLPFLTRARDVVMYHHERWDGTGYPDGLAGEEIPLWARIFAIVDAVDQATSGALYRSGAPLEAACAEISARAGTDFDPQCVASFLALDRRELLTALHPARENRLESLFAVTG